MSTPLSVLEYQLAAHRQETARLEALIAQARAAAGQKDAQSSSGGVSVSTPIFTALGSSSLHSISPPIRKLSPSLSPQRGSSPSVSPLRPGRRLSSPTLSARSILDEPWAQAAAELANSPPARRSSSSTSSLAWYRNWSHPFARPPVAPDDEERCTVAGPFATEATAEEGIFASLCRLGRLMLNVKFAAVNIVAAESVTFKAADIVHAPLIGFKGAPREISLCNWTIVKGSTLLIPDMKADPAFTHHPICQDYHCRFYAGSPLITSAGVQVGTFCVLDPEPQPGFGADKMAMLELLAGMAVSQLELSRLKSSRDQFHYHVLANVSHELRTPLNGVFGFLELIAEQPLTPLQADYLRETREQAGEILSLVNDLLDYVKAEAAVLSLCTQTFRPHDLLTAAAETFRSALDDRKLRLRLDQPYSAHMSCSGDATRVRQIITNLLSNALKFCRPHHLIHCRVTHHATRPQLTPQHPTYHRYTPPLTSSPRHAKSDAASTTASPSASPPGQQFFVYVQVADAGSGIAARLLPQIFDRFYQEDRHTLARRFDGAGLGLALCKKLTALMDGELMVESKQGEGSVFHLVLPLSYGVTEADIAITVEEKEKLLRFSPPVLSSLALTDSPSPNALLTRRLTNYNRGSIDKSSPSLVTRHHVHHSHHSSSGSTLSPLLPRSEVPSPVGPSRDSPLPVSPSAAPSFLTHSSSAASIPSPLSLGAAAAASSVSPASPAPTPGVRQVLIVDDNAVNLKVAARMLSSSSAQCFCAKSGKEALSIIQSQPVDIVLMDLQVRHAKLTRCSHCLPSAAVQLTLRPPLLLFLPADAGDVSCQPASAPQPTRLAVRLPPRIADYVCRCSVC